MSLEKIGWEWLHDSCDGAVWIGFGNVVAEAKNDFLNGSCESHSVICHYIVSGLLKKIIQLVSLDLFKLRRFLPSSFSRRGTFSGTKGSFYSWMLRM